MLTTTHYSSCIINGEPIDATRHLQVHNPATGEHLADVPDLEPSYISQAIDAAANSFSLWSTKTAYERCLLLEQWQKLIATHAEELAAVLTAEQGKPLSEAMREIRYANSYVKWYAEESKRIYGETIPAERPNQRIIVLKQPIGVVAAITPWNFPAAMVLRKLAAALAAGCTTILKPAPETPLTALLLVRLAHDAGMPAGVVNVVTGDAEMIGRTLLADTRVRKLTFTGSTEIGQLLMRESSTTLKRLTLELGGNAAFILSEDGDMERALSGAMFAKFRNAGQTCISANRFLIHQSRLPEFTEQILQRVQKLKVGNGAQSGVDIGPLISEEALIKVDRLVQQAKMAGAKLLCGGDPSQAPFYSPTVLSNVTPEMDIWNEEIFGPVVCISSFSSDAEAIAQANSIPHGLVHYVYCSSLQRSWLYAEQLAAGMVGINDTAISCAQAPFGGIKASGFGREGSHVGIEEYLQIKYLSLGV